MIEPLSKKDVQLMHSCLRQVSHSNCDGNSVVEVGRIKEVVQAFSFRMGEIQRTQSIYNEVTWQEIEEAIDKWFGGAYKNDD